VNTFDVDGFRFDTADNPYGPMRKITLDFWKGLRTKLLAAKPGLFLLGESEDPELTAVVFDADYGWKLWGQYATGLQQVAKDGADAMSNMKAALAVQAPGQVTGFLPATRHMTLTQTWDADVDIKIFGGVPNTMAAAVFNFTFSGLPMISAGEEVGNDKGEYNSHTVVNWASPNAAAFTPFYQSLLALRNANPALQQGEFAWLDNSSAQHVLSFTRSDSSAKFIVVINLSSADVSGTLTAAPSGTWQDVSPAGSPGGTAHAAPPSFSLKAYDFAVFRNN
jgi:glycosidase